MEIKNIQHNFLKNMLDKEFGYGNIGKIVTRFPPEPNGYLHIGHVRSIVLNFELANEFNGITNLRFDDTNPMKEDQEYVESIKEDISWLGYKWDGLYYTSNYFEEIYNFAVMLIKKDLAFVCDLTTEEIRQTRGSLTEAGIDSPYRNRSIEENLLYFNNMRKGLYKNCERVLRAKIDMSSPNINMRDPVFYRISHTPHQNTADNWCIYPMYDFAHPISDAIEGVTHSLCSIEFEDHRPLYDWVINQCAFKHKPRQYEYGRLNLANSVTSKRKIKQLVDSEFVDGWDDPRLPTLSGMRRRGYTPNSIKKFIRETGVSKNNITVDRGLLDHYLREDLISTVPALMAIINPLKVVITNYPRDESELLEVDNNPKNKSLGKRNVTFSKEIYIEREDFMEEPVAGFHRLSLGNEVRLMNAYYIKCNEIIKDSIGDIVELKCTYDPATKSGSGFIGRKVKGVIHWLDATHALEAEFRYYDSIVDKKVSASSMPNEVNHESIITFKGYVENQITSDHRSYQFVRKGFFCKEEKYVEEKNIFNLICQLKSSFIKS